MSAPVELSSYRSEWPAKFEAEKAVLKDILGPWLGGKIEHVGSTAVPGLIAKPVIDIMVGVKSLDSSKPAIDVLVNHSYQYFPLCNECWPGSLPNWANFDSNPSDRLYQRVTR